MKSSVEIAVEGRTLQLVLKTSRFDASIAKQVVEACEAAWQREINRITVDLGMVQFIDSSGVGAMLALYKKLPPLTDAVPSRMRLTHVSEGIRSVIELLRLEQVMEMEGI